MKLLRRAVVIVVLAGGAACGNGNDNGRGPSPEGSPTPLPAPTACPERVTFSVVREGARLDLGLTGNIFDATFSDRASLTLAIECGASGRDPGDDPGDDPVADGCTACEVAGPAASTTSVDNRRCTAAMDIACAADNDCPTGACEYFFGPPIPQQVGGAPACLVYRVEDASGTVDPATGQSDLHIDAVWSFYIPLAPQQPCPVCSGAEVDSLGTCIGGAREGAPCTVHATDADLGNTSFDCPPNDVAHISDFEVSVPMTTGTSALAPTAACTEDPFTGLPCYCQNQRRPNHCIDRICTVAADGEGTCNGGPTDTLCELEPFRGCLSDAHCPAAGDRCVSRLRPCSGPTDATGGAVGPLRRAGAPDPAMPTLAGVFCVGSGAAPPFDEGVGLAGPAAVTVPARLCFARSCAF